MKQLSQFSLEGIETYLLDVLGDDPPEMRPQKYVEALQGIGIDGICKFIISLLEQGIPSQIVENSYFHPNKFFKLAISRLSNKVKLRLHFWNKDHLEVQTPIHFHAWDFASMLICGSYLHDLFDVTDLDDALVAQIEQTRNSGKHIDNCFGMYKIPKRNGSLEKFQPEWIKYVQATRRSRTVEKQGSTYFLGMQFPHQITIDLKNVGSMITLVLTSETNHNNLFTFQPITKAKTFDNPSPNVDEAEVRAQLKLILDEINKTIGVSIS